MELSLTLNGNSLTIDVEPQLTLMEFLRDRQHLKGTKNGCATGHCGACTVIVNGKAVRSCLVKMGKLGEAAKVETIEGLAQGDVLHPLQYTFIEEGAVQCGYCTSGSIMSAKALLDENPNRSETEIKDWLTKQKNLCRCTGYVNMVHAIQKAGEMMARGQATPAFEPEGLEIRSTQMRKDLIEIVRGEKVYAGDIEMPGLLHGKILWSEHPHAEILSVDTSEALKMPGVVTTVTAWDIPGINRAGVIAVNRDQPAIAGREQKARYIGDSIASVFAETEEQAAAALEKIKVEYKVLQPVFSPEEAAMPDAPKVHAKGNLLHHSRIERGNVEDAFAKCAVISEHEYYTPMIEHGFLEPEAGVAYPNTSGGVTMMTGSQSVFDERNQLSEILA
ncbi:MAG TPA: 2Fe-2S iron-sulfur cluster-binding protein, partial [Bellilinea sp.]|nr:2Fe-2S iron-sulfur cluster-binding protein [Bellilinea sp.]